MIAHFLSLTATRETSFVHAISAAGVMYTLTRNCSLGDLDNCGCDVSRNGKIGEEHIYHSCSEYYLISDMLVPYCAHKTLFNQYACKVMIFLFFRGFKLVI